MTIASKSGRMGIDIGGTFTDIALEIGQKRFTSKVLTTSDNPVDGCLAGLRQVMQAASAEPADISVVIHGTTLATNAIIERKGAVTSFVTTRGFRDTIEIGTEGRPEQYDINIIKPQPLVPRRRRFSVAERLDRHGNALLALDREELEALLPRLDAAGTEALAIGFVNSYVNPDHEIRVRRFFQRRRAGWSISISSEISPEFREYERFSTTCANAYLQPLMSSYLAGFERELRALGYGCPLLLMLSSGGLTSIETAREFPVRLIESGPAGGAIFAGGVARRLGLERAISFDMGGTTAKICMLDGGRAQTSRRFEVARVYRFRKDSGLPIRVPVIDMVEIGAGGGSIAHVDELGRLAVGPRSAGADPGPACYRRGGTGFTVTDANLIMGRMDPRGFAGGSIRLHSENAVQAAAEGVGASLGLDELVSAYGVTEVVCENMAGATRVHAIESGKNANDRALIAFGGAAPLHVCQMADKLNVDRIIVPRNAGVGSAVGFLRAPISYEMVQTVYEPLDGFDSERANGICTRMEAAARRHVEIGVGGNASLTVRRKAYMRYRGQGHEIPVEVPAEPFGPDAARWLQELFDREYRRVFGRNVGGVASGEIVSWSVEVASEPFAEPSQGDIQLDPPVRSTRSVFDPACQARIQFAVVGRNTLRPGTVIDGPAIMFEDETSIVVAPAFAATVLENGDIELARKSTQDGRDNAGI
ncbi:MAG: hydantoinase/oxoprolinase family protein [Rhodobacteraceae bacterium]|nr:hydantoinase/oxoprolinase family protein [Paracoccaceae bacterium]